VPATKPHLYMSKTKLIFLIVLLGIVAVSLWYIYQNQNRDVGLQVILPTDVFVGVPLDAQVSLSNQSGTILNDVSLTMTLPSGVVFVGSGEEKLIENRSLGNIGEGSLNTEHFQIAFLKGANTTQAIKVSVSYSPSSLGARFEEQKKTEIAVKTAGVVVSLRGPQKVLSGEEFPIELVYQNMADTDANDLVLQLVYPADFSFTSSSLKPDIGKDTWNLGDLRKGSEGKFSVRGSLLGPDNAVENFLANLKVNLKGRVYTLEPQPFQLTVTPSPLLLNIKINDQVEYITKPDEALTYVVSYVNNTDTALRDAVIRVRLVGEMFDLNTLETNAVLRLSDSTLVWNSQNAPELNLLSPNSAGFVQFKVRTKHQYPIRRFGDKNFVLKTEAQIESPTVPPSVSASRTLSVKQIETKVSGNLTIATKAYFRDAAAGFVNKGSLPLRVGQATDFTIHWLLQNAADDVSKLEMRASLPEGVKFTGQVTSNFGSPPTYDAANNQVVWVIDTIPANKGIVDQPIEAVFQVEATPAAAQVGSYMSLLGDTSVKATDNFTNSEITATAGPVTTALSDDQTVGQKGGVVQP